MNKVFLLVAANIPSFQIKLLICYIYNVPFVSVVFNNSSMICNLMFIAFDYFDQLMSVNHSFYWQVICLATISCRCVMYILSCSLLLESSQNNNFCLVTSRSEICHLEDGMSNSQFIPDRLITGTPPSTSSSPSDARPDRDGWKVPARDSDGNPPVLIVDLTPNDAVEPPITDRVVILEPLVKVHFHFLALE